VRIFEFAKEVGVSSKELLALLHQLGHAAENHMAGLSDTAMQAVIQAKKSPPTRPSVGKPPEQKSALKSAKTSATENPAPPEKPAHNQARIVKPQKALPPTPKPTPSVAIPVKRAGSTSGGRSITPVPPPPPPAPEKKKLVLIKKKPEAVPPIPAPVLADVAETPGLLSASEAPYASVAAPVAGTQPVLPFDPGAAHPPSPRPPSQGAAVTPTIKTIPASPGFTPAPSVPPRPIGEGDKKGLRKKGKGAEKGGGPPKTKLQKWRRSDWTGIQVEGPVVAEGDVAVEAAPVVKPQEAPIETRKWQDFKPVHWKDDRRGAKRGRAAAPVEITKPRRKVVKLSEGMTVKDLSERLGQKAQAIIGKMLEMGKMAAINQPIDLTEAALIAEAFDIKVEFTAQQTEEEILNIVAPDAPGKRVPRPPVITIMGHVDHGKTSLLDAIRQTKVTEGEAGGITQHIGAYSVLSGGKTVTFLDTPGHEAFTSMRARGASVTDIVVLVVAADDGVMPQTLEAIDHARAAGVPIVVAVNKIDKPEANVERVKGVLAEQGLLPEEWGGKTIYAEVSAKKKLGLDHFLEMLLLQAEVMELTANPEKGMVGVIIEARMDRGRGPVATVLVREGTLRVGDIFVTGTCFGRVRALVNDEGCKVEQAGPSTPVEVIGLTGVPQAGDTFVVVADEHVAKSVAGQRMQRQRIAQLSIRKKITLEDLHESLKQGSVKELTLILKADVQGSVEAVRASLEKLSSPRVKLRVIHGGVGGVTESDVLLAAASNAIIIGFNVRPEPNGRDLAERENVDIRLYTIIYDAIADVKAAMEGLLDPTFKERTLGRVDVRQVFTIPKVGAVAGGYVLDGVITRNSVGARVLRDHVVIYEGKLASLRRFKDDVKEVASGYECGLGIENFNDIKVGDVIEVYTRDKIAAVL